MLQDGAQGKKKVKQTKRPNNKNKNKSTQKASGNTFFVVVFVMVFCVSVEPNQTKRTTQSCKRNILC